ncbi:MAG: hypothetical protein ACKV2V_21880 [Blastocatellia bacterium]
MNIMTRKLSITGLTIFSLFLLAFLPAYAQSTRPRVRPQSRPADPPGRAAENGYRAGYEDGFDLGKRDGEGNHPRDFGRSEDFQRADRTYQTRMGELREYQDGYQAGYELGYNDGYFGRAFSDAIPARLHDVIGSTHPPDTSADNRNNAPVDNRNAGANTVTLEDGTKLVLRLTSQINTKTNREGDQFTATVLAPFDLEQATVTGHIAKLRRSGRATGKTELSLAFDTITTRGGGNGNFEGQVEEISASENVKTVDEEGNVQTSSKSKETVTRSAGGGAVGAIIGAIAGGGKGAAIGAAIGAAVGAGSVVIQGNKDLILDPGTEMTIRVNGPARTAKPRN